MMKKKLLFPFLLAAASCAAQQWEVGGALGYSFYRNATFTTPAGNGSAGFLNGFMFSIVGGHDMYRFIGGEFRYSRIENEGKLRLNGQEARLDGESHAFHYDFLFHAAPRNAWVRPFVAVGGGAKLYRGTGQDRAAQTLLQYGALTRTSETQPLVSAGAGVKVRLGPNALLRVEMRDYATPFPDNVITPLRSSRISGWLHDIVPMAGISLVF